MSSCAFRHVWRYVNRANIPGFEAVLEDSPVLILQVSVNGGSWQDVPIAPAPIQPAASSSGEVTCILVSSPDPGP